MGGMPEVGKNKGRKLTIGELVVVC